MESWQVCSLEEVVKFIDYRGKTPKKTEDGMRLITAKNVKMGYLQSEPMEFVDPQLVAGFPAWVNLSESSCLRGLLSFLTKIAQVSLVLIVDRRKDGSISTVAMDSHAFDLRTV